MPDTSFYHELAKKGDYDAIVEYAADGAVRIINELPDSEEEYNNFEAFVNELFVHEKNKPIPAENKKILDAIADALIKKSTQAAVECERDIRKNEQKIKNGEYAEFSFLKNDEKTANKLAEVITYSQSPAGLRLNSLGTVSGIIKFSVHDRITRETEDKIRNGSVKALQEALKKEFKDMPEQKLNNKGYLIDRFSAQYSGINSYRFVEKPVDPGISVVTSQNEYHEEIKGYSDDQLILETVKKEKLVKQYKQDRKEMADLAVEAQSLKDDITKMKDLDLNNKAVKDMMYEIDNATKFGTDEYMYYTVSNNSSEEVRGKTSGVDTDFYGNGLYIMGKTADDLKAEYEVKNTPEAEAALQAANKVISFVNERKTRLVGYIEHNKQFRDYTVPTIDLKDLNQEKENRSLASEKFNELAADCVLGDQKINFIGRYVGCAKQGLDILSKGIEFFYKDRTTHKKPSSSYTAFADSMAELGQINAATTAPDKLLEKMKQAYDAACVYEQKHTGWNHPLTGHSDKAQDRIYYSQLAKNVLAKKIAQLTPEAEKIKPMLFGRTPDTAIEMYEKNNASTRSQMQEEMQRIKNENAEKKPMSFLDDKIRFAQAEIKLAKESVGDGEYPDNDSLSDKYARIISATNLIRAVKKAGIRVDEDIFMKQCKVITTGRPFKNMMKSCSPELLFKQASDQNGQQLYLGYTAEMNKSNLRAEEAKSAHKRDMEKVSKRKSDKINNDPTK